MTHVLDRVEAPIVYPSYKSLDEFIDVGWLKSLDGYITERVRRRLEAHEDHKFYTGPFRLKEESPDRPGTRMIYLSRSSQPDSYYDLDRPELWEPTPEAKEFAELSEFIRSLPFASTGRMLIMYDDAPRPVTPHRDHDVVEVCHEFVWFRTNLSKPFYMLDHRTREKLYVSSHSAWFDTVNQFHGSDACDGLTFSVRVDGRFTDEFRSLIPRPRVNPASAPSLWACAGAGFNF
ncbi:MAG: hypothetical protein LC795_09005 [Acidobacteria bacterium]|nr:hypothetical protein [Acidobacteriota bacterium]